MNKSSQSYVASIAMGSHSVTFHPTQVNTLRLTPAGQWYSINLLRRDRRLN